MCILILDSAKFWQNGEIMSGKRTDYISWDDYFMGVSLLAADRSKDPSTQVGACIVSDDTRILSTGYNGFPQGCSDDDFPWNRDESLGARQQVSQSASTFPSF